MHLWDDGGRVLEGCWGNGAYLGCRNHTRSPVNRLVYPRTLGKREGSCFLLCVPPVVLTASEFFFPERDFHFGKVNEE